MSQNADINRKALDTYFKEKGIDSDKSKRLYQLLGSNSKKYEKKRKKWFPGFENYLKSKAGKKQKALSSRIEKLQKLCKESSAGCQTGIKKAQSKAAECKISLEKVTAEKIECSEQLKIAKRKVKLIEKISSTASSKNPNTGKRSAKLSGLLKKVNVIKDKANKSLTIIETNHATQQQIEKRLNANKKKADQALAKNQANLEKIQSAETELKNYAASLKELKSARSELTLISELPEKINQSKSLKGISTVSESIKKSLSDLNNLDSSYTGAKAIRQNNFEFLKIKNFLTKANTYWISSSGHEEVEFFDNLPYYIYYEGQKIYPRAVKKNTPAVKAMKSDLSKGYIIQKKKKGLVRLQGLGWCVFEDLYTEDQKNRQEYMNGYQSWLNQRFSHLDKLRGEGKLNYIKGILSQSETIVRAFSNSTPSIIDSLDKNPKYRNHTNQTTTPHELIGILRQWIQFTEKDIKGLKEEKDANENAGSLYSDIDWNTRIKVPQYRTQSDNLISPETTCAPTTFTMMAERAGWSRSDLITAIEKRFTDSGLTDIGSAWTTKVEAFLKWVNKNSTKNYQKVRAGKIREAKFDQLAKNAKNLGQYEDLAIFYHYLINSSSKTTMNSSANHNLKLRQGLENDGNFKKSGSYKYKKITGHTSDLALRRLVKDHLDSGNVVMFSIFHKGNKGGTHNYFVQSINHLGFIIDDPFGGGNINYRRKSKLKADLYKGKNTAKGRNEYNFKNKADFNILKRDFTMQKAQNLSEKESRGDSSLLSWEMIEGSTLKIVNYVVIWERIGSGV